MWLSGRVSAQHAQTFRVRHPVMHGRAVEVNACRGRTEQAKGREGGAQAHPQGRGRFRASIGHCLTLLEEILRVFHKERQRALILDKLKGK